MDKLLEFTLLIYYQKQVNTKKIFPLYMRRLSNVYVIIWTLREFFLIILYCLRHSEKIIERRKDAHFNKELRVQSYNSQRQSFLQSWSGLAQNVGHGTNDCWILFGAIC